MPRHSLCLSFVNTMSAADASAPAVATVQLISSDKESFTVPLELVSYCKTITNILDDLEVSDDTKIPLPNVDSKTLAHIIACCKKADELKDPKKLTEWFCDSFVKDLNQQATFDLTLAANYLSCQIVLNASCSFIAGLINGKTPEEIRGTFGIKNDFTPDEEAEIRRENSWAFV